MGGPGGAAAAIKLVLQMEMRSRSGCVTSDPVSLVPCDLVISYFSSRKNPTVFFLINGSWVDGRLSRGAGCRKDTEKALGWGPLNADLRWGGECQQRVQDKILGSTSDGWGSEARAGRKALREDGVLSSRLKPCAAMLSSAGELGEMVRSTPKLFHLGIGARAFTPAILISHWLGSSQGHWLPRSLSLAPGGESQMLVQWAPRRWQGTGSG